MTRLRTILAPLAATILGGCMNPFLVSSIRKNLNTPLDFQEKFGNKPQEIHGADLPDDTWQSLTLRGWTFRKTWFFRTTFQADTFENVLFEECIFDRADFRNNVFRNCTFRNNAISSGTWEGNTFSGGKIQDLQLHHSPKSNDGIFWENQTFEKVVFQELVFGDRAGDWKQCKFNHCEFDKNDFTPIAFRSPTFRQCSFSNNSWKGSESGVSKGTFENCRFTNNDFAKTGFNGSFKLCTFQGGSGFNSGGSFEDGTISQSKGGVELGKTANTKIENVERFLQISNSAQNVSINGVAGAAFIVSDGGSEIKVENLEIINLALGKGTFKGCTFKNVKAENLDIDGSHFVDCHFEDVHITRRIYMAEPATFTNCTFENFRRDANVEVAGERNIAIPGYLFPFESAPRVNRP